MHGRRRELHRARDVGAGHRQPRLLQPEQALQVLLLGDGRRRLGLLAAHPEDARRRSSRGRLLSCRAARTCTRAAACPRASGAASRRDGCARRRRGRSRSPRPAPGAAPTHSRSLPALQRLGSAEPRSPDSYSARKPTSRFFSAALRPEQCPTTRSCIAVVEAEDQRADGARLLARPPAHEHRVDRAHALDLRHALALARAIRRGDALCDRSLGVREPALGLGDGGDGRPSARPERARTRRRRAARSSAARRSAKGALEQRRRRSRRAGRTRRTPPASRRRDARSRETAGWMRWPSASKSSRPSASRTTISPSST